MKINNIDSNTNFGKVYCGGTIINRLGKSDCPQEFVNGYKAVRAALESRNLHRLENIDLTINYAQKDGFFATVADKEYGIPDLDQYKHKVSTDKNHLDVVEAWAHDWDYAYESVKEKAYDCTYNVIRYIRDNYKF
ncbi:MAG: hypothetical protein NC408_08970 [Candidatus Gastranaerophilales bacterium]|nr:hypothetical protein [Candidatus Gastranaerophilales bacterium]MCM1073503.1 hypothetical protein [Bacteroides sp.]